MSTLHKGRNSLGTLTFFFLNHFLGEEQFWYFNFFLSLSFFGRNSSEISLRGWHLVIVRAEQQKKHPVDKIESKCNVFYTSGAHKFFSRVPWLLIGYVGPQQTRFSFDRIHYTSTNTNVRI